MKSFLVKIIALSFISSGLWAGPVTRVLCKEGDKACGKTTGKGAHAIAAKKIVKDVK